MSVTVRMPQLGETVMEGTILRWAKEPGDAISEEEVLLEVSTDKVDTEVPSRPPACASRFWSPPGETVPSALPWPSSGRPENSRPPPRNRLRSRYRRRRPPCLSRLLRKPSDRRAQNSPRPRFGETEKGPPPIWASSPRWCGGWPATTDLDLREVAGTDGKAGHRKDVQAFIDARAQAAPETPVSEVPVPAVVMPEAAPAGPPCRSWRSSRRPVGIAPAEPVPTPPAPPVAARYPKAAAEPAPVAAPPKRVGLGRGIGALIPTGAIPTAARPVTAPEAAPEAAPGRRPGRRRPGRTGTQAADDGPAAAQRSAEDPSRLRMRIAEHNGHQPAHRRSRVDGGGGRLRAVEQVRRRRRRRSRARGLLSDLPALHRPGHGRRPQRLPRRQLVLLRGGEEAGLPRCDQPGIAVDLDQRGLIVMNIPVPTGFGCGNSPADQGGGDKAAAAT